MNYNHIKSEFSNFADKRFREYQEAAIDFIHNSKAKISVICCPTGFGKSLVNVCAGALQNKFTYLVSSKQLQDQLEEDFSELKVLKGRNNYPCHALPGKNCDSCIHTSYTPCDFKKGQPGGVGCVYERQKRYVLKSKYKLLNYHYFLHETNYVGRFSKASPIVICDEGDLLEHLLSDFISLRISGRVQKRFKIRPPMRNKSQLSHDPEHWKVWAELTIETLANRIQYITSTIQYEDDERKVELSEEKDALETVVKKAKLFQKHLDDSWILELKRFVYSNTPTISFRPTWISEELAEQYFWKHADRFVLSSATFHPEVIMGKLLGRNSEDFEYFEAPSSFPVERRQVYLNNVANLTSKTFDEESPKILLRVGEIMAQHPDEKGLIHTVSYKLASLIANNIHSNRLIFHNSANREQQIRYFRDTDAPLILVSPSLERGLDLPDDLCRFIVWCKCPYLNVKDKLVSARLKGGRSNVGNLWYKSSAAQTLIQGCGRGMRHVSDKCIIYILDQQGIDLILNFQALFPKYFLDACDIL